MLITKILIGDTVYKMAKSEGEGVAFIWAGGAYIDMIVSDSRWGNDLLIDGKVWGYSDQNINIWDYENDCPEFDWDDDTALILAIQEWMSA